jgi:hypothetical protein
MLSDVESKWLNLYYSEAAIPEQRGGMTVDEF